MSLLSMFLGGGDINAGVEEYKNTEKAVLLDVRSSQEYRSGHIPGAVNVPVGSISKVANKVKQKDTPIFAYCLSGSRSSSACAGLKRMGYTHVKNIGGIGRYRGPLNR